MKALWLEQGVLSLRDLPEPERARGDDTALTLEVRRAGICGTDLELLEGYADFTGTPGHEFVATVVGGPAAWHGRRVVAEINLACGGCRLCRLGYPKHCLQRSVIGIRGHPGAFTERFVVPAANCHVVPDAITDIEAVLVEPLAAALEIPRSIDINTDDRVLVLGAGRLANLVAQVMSHHSRRVDVLVRRAARRAAFDGVDVRCLEVPETDYDIVVEVTGQAAGLALALEHIRARGTVVLKSTYADSPPVDMSRVVVDEIRLAGSRCGPFDTALAWLGAGRVRLDQLQFEVFGLEDHARSFACARDPAVYKVMFAPGG